MGVRIRLKKKNSHDSNQGKRVIEYREKKAKTGQFDMKKKFGVPLLWKKNWRERKEIEK